jgi:predicted MFS family arabinose efflux permease
MLKRLWRIRAPARRAVRATTERGVESVGIGSRPAELGPGAVTRATVILIALRVGYAYNWFDVGPALVPIGSAFGVGPAEWGLLVAAFLVGAGLLQVPAGLLARRFGPRAVSLWGVGLLAAAGTASAFSPNFLVLLALRLAAGFGAALFFSPAIGLVASLYPSGRRGLPVGTFSSAFSLGAALGVLGTSLLLPAIGWRDSLLFGGVLLGALTLLGIALIPRAAGAPPRGPPVRGVPTALRFRGVWAVGFAFVGIEGASFATGQFIVPWGVTVQGWTLALAGAIGTLFVLPSLFGGPVGGPIAERFRNHRTQFVIATVVSGVLLALLPFAGLAETIAIGIVFSFSYGFVYAVMYVLPHYWRSVPSAEVPLAIGLFNSIQLAGGAAVSFLFGWIVAATSYSFAWIVLGLACVVTLAALIALPPTPPADADGPRAAAELVPP